MIMIAFLSSIVHAVAASGGDVEEEEEEDEEEKDSDFSSGLYSGTRMVLQVTAALMLKP